MAYTPLTTGQTPTQGTSGQGVIDLQNQLNAGGANLAVDGLYGPKTAAAFAASQTKPTSNLVTTSNAANMEHTKYSGMLDEQLAKFGTTATDNQPIDPATYSDAFTKTLDQQAKSSNESTQAMIQSLQAKTQAKQVALAAQYDNYKRGLQMLGIQHNEAQSSPDLLLGHEQQAQNEYTSKVGALDTELHKALIDAQAARDTKNTAELKTKMDYIKSIQTQKAQALKDVYSSLTQQKSFDTNFIDQAFNELMKLPTSKRQEYLQAVADKTGQPLLGLTQALADKIAKGGGKSGGSVKVSQGVASLTPQFESVKGADGYIDPYKWVTGRTKWMSMGLSKASYESNFKQYLNPESYKLAGFTTKSSTGGGSTFGN